MPGALLGQVLPQKLTCGWIKTLWLPVVQELGEAHLLPSQRSRTTCASSSEVLFLLGMLVFAMSLQLDRRGAWNMMGPCLFAFAVMATMWVRSWGNLMLLAHTPSLVTGVGAWSLHSVGEQSPAPHSGHASHPGPESCTPADATGGPLGAQRASCLRTPQVFVPVYLCGHRRHCYPTSWQRWAFCLLPGISMAVVAIAIYTSMTTSDNYYYTHSIWHMLLAGSATFLLPPRDAHTKPWACSQELPCHYQICRNHQEELYRGGVTGSWQLSG
ncbi:post-GPI attachment to proteins factor 6-like isoform X2 [Manis javanica]|uniref:post-GPI attachment to proteins factor 6-like isoform X2 n=1 Tax=Manis javanica TaxID=9974 RepID=UPI003C6CE012